MSTSIKRRNLPLLLLQVREAVFSHFRPIVSHFGLTEQQWRIMRALSELGELEQNQIADTCQILAPSLAGVLTRMEAVDFVRRRRHDSDARRVLVSLTPKGQGIVERAVPLIKAQYENLEKAVGRDIIDGLYRALDAYLDASHAAVEPVPLPPPDDQLPTVRERKTSAGRTGSRRPQTAP